MKIDPLFLVATADGDRTAALMMSIMVILALSFVVFSDWLKRKRVNTARLTGKPIPKYCLNNQTDWRSLALLILMFSIYVFLLANPQLTDGDFGAFDPMMKWLFGPLAGNEPTR